MITTKAEAISALREIADQFESVPEVGPGLSKVLGDVIAERKVQDERFGPENDERNTDYDWHSHRRKFEDRVLHGPIHFTEEATAEARTAARRANLVKVAALAIAQIESLDRKPPSF